MTLTSALRQQWGDLPFAHKLAWLLIALVSLPIVVVVVYTTQSNRAALILSTQARDLERARGTAEVIDAFFADAKADVRTASRLFAVVDLCTHPPMTATQAYERAMQSLQAVQREQHFIAMYVTDRAGRVLAATDDRVTLGSRETGRAFLAAVAGDTAVDDPMYDPFDRTVAMKVSHAVRGPSDEIIGTVTALIDVTALDRLAARDTDYAGHGEFSVLWTAAGVRLTDSGDPSARFSAWAPLSPETATATQQRLGPAYPVGDHSADPAYAALTDRGAWLLYDVGTNPHVRLSSQRFGRVHVTVVPLEGQRWLYGIFVPERQLLASLRGQTLRDWAVAFFTVLAAFTLSVIAARWVTKPLRRVTDAANALAAGDMEKRVGLDRRDELGQLGSAFDRMVSALADNERLLQAHAAELERRVEDRTATLQLFERASRTLASSLELRRTAANLATLLVPANADFCAVDVRERNANVRRVACRHVDTTLDRLANQVPEIRVVRDAASTLTAENRTLLKLGDVRAYELTAGRQFVGYLTVAMSSSSHRSFDAAAERIFEELGRRAGLALANSLLYQEAQDASRLKDEFLGVVSHELRTPLNAILGWTRLAGLGRDAGIDRQKALDAVDRNARALARLVDDLLDVPRIIAGKLTLDLRPIDLVAVVAAATDAIRPAAVSKGVTVEWESDEPSATIAADAHRLQQVFGNLLSNAVKFTPVDGHVRARVCRSGERYTVSITDTGAGIPPDFLPFVFDRFRQADSSTTRAHGGLGIGLSIVRHLVEMHGGHVTAASEGPGRGSTFLVQLPIGYPEPGDVDDSPEVTREVAAVDELHGLHVLVLDDDPDSREVVASLLQTAGATVASAASVPEAFATLTASPGEFDAVLADIGMPGQDGFAFIAELRAAPDTRLRGIPVVAVTAYASPADRARALAAGFDHHVAKPVSLNALGEGLTQSLALRGR